MTTHQEDQIRQPAKRGTTRRNTAGSESDAAPAQRRCRRVLLVLILLLLPFSFWLGRLSVTPQAMPAAPTVVAATTSAQAPVPVKTKVHAALSKLAESVRSAAGALTSHHGRATALLEVSVGTGSCGGLTLTFDHPVKWTTQNPVGGSAELDVQGVRALGTFPRNLPLPAGVDGIHAVITPPDTLDLKFDVRPGVQAYTVGGEGPSATVYVRFRAPLPVASAVTGSAGPAMAGICGPDDLAAAVP